MTLHVSSQRAALPCMAAPEEDPRDRPASPDETQPCTPAGRIAYAQALLLSAQGRADILAIAIDGKDWPRAAEDCRQLRAQLAAAEHALALT